MKINCPGCRGELPIASVNIPADLAQCPTCGELFKPSSLLVDEAPVDVALPAGCTSDIVGRRFKLTASTRSPVAFFLVPFMIVWSGGSLGGIYGSQIASGEFDPAISLFGVPFLLGSVLFWSIALMAVAGRVEVSGEGDRGEVFTGVGPIGWGRDFRWSEVQRIVEAGASVRYPGGSGSLIALEGGRRVEFASGLSAERRYWLLHTLRRVRAAR